MKTLIVSSSEGELIDFKKMGYITLACGIGNILSSSLTVKTIIDKNVDVVISVGSAGRRSDSHIRVGDIISFEKVYSYDQNLSSLGFNDGETVNSKRKIIGEIKTSDNKSIYSILSSSSLQNSPKFSYKFDALDMESYGVGVASMLFSIPFYVVKVITDTIGDGKGREEISALYKEKRSELTLKVKDLLS